MGILKRSSAVQTRAALLSTAADLSNATTPEVKQKVLRDKGITDVPDSEVKAFTAELRRQARRG